MSKLTLLPEDALGHLPPALRAELLDAFGEIVTNYRAGRWESSALHGGKLSEIVYSILNGHVNGSFPSRSSKPANIVDACRALEKVTGSFPRSVKVGIPRVLMALYEIRNNRSVGHVGGDVDPNHMDSEVVLALAKWTVAELVRIFHDVPVLEATAIVEALSTREVPMVWDSGKVKRVLDPTLSAKESVLLLLYASADIASVEQLLEWTEYANASRFKNEVLGHLHRVRDIEYDKKSGTVAITPKGMRLVEESLPLRAA